MKVVVAIYSPFRAWCIPDASLDWLRNQFPGHTFARADDAEATLREIVDADIAFSSQITAAHVRTATRLRWIHSPAAGVGSMLSPEMIASPIVMTNSRGTSAVTIAEHTIAVTLALLRKLPLTLQRQRERVWAQLELYGEPPISTLRGQRVLIVGLGAIGSETARLAAAFGAEVVGLRRHPGRLDRVHVLRRRHADRHAQARDVARRFHLAARRRRGHVLEAPRPAGSGRRQLQEPFLGGTMDLVVQMWRFLGARRKFWLLPIILVTVLIGGLLILAQGSVVAPFIYTLF